MNGTPRSITPARKPLFDRFVDQVNKGNDWIAQNPGAFVVGVSIFSVGIIVGSKVSVPQISKAEVLNEWLREANAAGINIYGLTNEQKKLWETIWQYVEAESKQFGLPVSKVVGELLSDYAYLARPRNAYSRVA